MKTYRLEIIKEIRFKYMIIYTYVYDIRVDYNNDALIIYETIIIKTDDKSWN